MTPNQVREAVKEIVELRGDDEAAHSAEDELWAKVLLEISLGNSQAQKLAVEALRTREIEFERWCA